jgi:hypothetical protein
MNSGNQRAENYGSSVLIVYAIAADSQVADLEAGFFVCDRSMCLKIRTLT